MFTKSIKLTLFAILLCIIILQSMAGQPVKQSTGTTVLIGPLLGHDLVWPATLDVTSDIQVSLFKGVTNSILTITGSGGNNDMVHVDDGMYSLELTAGNLDTLGPLVVSVTGTVSTIISSDNYFEVMTARMFDFAYGSTTYVPSNITHLNGSSVSHPWDIANPNTFANAVWAKTVSSVTDSADDTMSEKLIDNNVDIAENQTDLNTIIANVATVDGKVTTVNNTVLDASVSIEADISAINVSIADDVLSANPNNYGSGTVGAYLSRIGSASVEVVNPVRSSGELELFFQDRYVIADNRALEFRDVSGNWPVIDASNDIAYLFVNSKALGQGSFGVGDDSIRYASIEIDSAADWTNANLDDITRDTSYNYYFRAFNWTGQYYKTISKGRATIRVVE